MRPARDSGSRFGIVLNRSPLFTGGAGSGESEIRRYVLENDLVEALIGLPTDMFYNTGISTYVRIVSNRKPAERKGKPSWFRTTAHGTKTPTKVVKIQPTSETGPRLKTFKSSGLSVVEAGTPDTRT